MLLISYLCFMEVLRDIKGQEGYKVSTEGKIFSLHNNKWGLGSELKELSTHNTTKKGYKYFRTYHNKSKNIKVVHRAVAIAFIPNPLNLPQVNHIDGVKTNNNVENLEWVTNAQNMSHARSLGLFNNAIEKLKVSINKLSLIGEFICNYESVNEAALDVGAKDNTGISKALKGVYNSSNGFKWEYVNN